jgi:hypothetical protein
MNGMLFAWFTTFLIGLGVVLMLVVVAVLLPRTVRMLSARFYCPWRSRNVTVRYLTCDGKNPSHIVSCTAFADPMVIACGAPCVGADGPLAAATREPASAVPVD